MLFTYKNCGCCKKEMTDLKDLLNNIFPAGICDEICDYNLHCSKCKNLNDKERRYIDFNYHFDYFNDKKLTRVEKTIYFFKNKDGEITYLFVQHEPNKHSANEKRN